MCLLWHLPQYYTECLVWHLCHCYCPQSGPAIGWINTSVSCLVKLPLWCCNYITLVPLVLWVMTVTSTQLQLSWLVERHGVGLLSLCFGWTIPKKDGGGPMVNRVHCIKFHGDLSIPLPFLLERVWRSQWRLVLWLVSTTMTWGGITKSCEKVMAGTNIVSTSNSCICNRMCALMKHYHCEWGTKPCLLQKLLYWLPPGTIMQWSSVFYKDT